jgi:hypothetical protein
VYGIRTIAFNESTTLEKVAFVALLFTKVASCYFINSRATFPSIKVVLCEFTNSTVTLPSVEPTCHQFMNS